SAYSGEGKTFSSLNLAMSIAVERDRRVLLVDADVVKPGLDKMLEMEDRPGLVEYLSGDVSSFSDILLTTNVHNLTIVPAGKTHHLSHELLASNAMQELAHEMSTRYSDRIIIFDCPPMLITSEAKVLAKLVGQIVLVVEQDKTSQSAVKDAIALLERDKLTGLVLNKSKSVGESYYGYYYSEDK
ncbi:MAG: polysaccharide biosynthesis tyrosine autokinase, partial [Pseudomonadales bacterium]|nr:polysaccharide biosynthesis tyrosine autokinase [Pseudomonadales bacterium]